MSDRKKDDPENSFIVARLPKLPIEFIYTESARTQTMFPPVVPLAQFTSMVGALKKTYCLKFLSFISVRTVKPFVKRGSHGGACKNLV